MAVADKFSNEPVVFIAVNSGNDSAAVKKYVRSNKVTWPVVVDMDRTFEGRADVPKVSTSNIMQFRSIDAKGKIRSFSGSNIEETARDLLKVAKWNVDVDLIPASLTLAHRLVEFGKYSAASKTLNAASKSRDEQVKTGAEALLAHVGELIGAKLELAEEAKQNEEPWEAFKIYTQTANQFDGYKMDVDLKATLKELKAKDEVKDEFAAQRLFLIAKNGFARTGQKRTVGKLKMIVEKYPDTEAAELSAEAIATLEK